MIDNRMLIARAVGIGGAHLDRWMDVPVPERKGDEQDHVFYLEGPIVGSIQENYMDNPKGFTTPAMLRDFLEENKGKRIEININSPGGSVFEANAMWTDLARHDGDIKIVVSGACMSAAVDFMTLPNAERIAMPGSLFMIHNAFTFAMGDSNAMRKVADRLEKINDQCADRMAESWKVFSKKDLMAMMDEETFFTEKEALDAGMVDSVWQEEKAEATEDGAEEKMLAVEQATSVVLARMAMNRGR